MPIQAPSAPAARTAARAAAGDATGGEDGDVGEGLDDVHKERKQVHRAGVPAGFVALRDEDVRADCYRFAGAAQRLHLADHLRARLFGPRGVGPGSAKEKAITGTRSSIAASKIGSRMGRRCVMKPTPKERSWPGA